MGQDVFVRAFVNVVRMSGDLGVMGSVIPSSPQAALSILPVKSVFADLYCLLHDKETLHHLQKVAAVQNEAIAKHAQIALGLLRG